jgi:HEAT repeat protein
MQAEEVGMIDVLDASDDRLRLAVARATQQYGEDELFACIADADTILRTAAARALQAKGSRRVFDRVLPLAGHPRHNMREIAAFILGQLGTPDRPFAAESFPALGRLLDDPYWEVRRAAAAAVGSLSGPGCQAPRAVQDRVIALAADATPDVRTSVAVALGTIDDNRAKACLERLLDDEDQTVREDAQLGLELRAACGLDGGGRVAAE